MLPVGIKTSENDIGVDGRQIEEGSSNDPSFLSILYHRHEMFFLDFQKNFQRRDELHLSFKIYCLSFTVSG